MTRLSKLMFAAAATVAIPSAALAQDGMEGEASAEGSSEMAPDPMTPPPDPNATGETSSSAAGGLFTAPGKLTIAGSTVNIGLFPDNAGKPISLAPSIFYGVNEKLVVGLTHDGGTTPWTPRPSVGVTLITVAGIPFPALQGFGICVTGDDGGCGKVYNNVGVDALYLLKSDAKFTLAAHPAIDVRSFDPFTLALRVGVLGNYAVNDKVNIAFDPRISIGLTERDFQNDVIDIPVWAWYKATPELGVYLHTGFAESLSDFGDSYQIPLGLGANYAINEQLTAGLDFHFLNMLGSDGGTDAKMIGLRAIYNL